MLAVEGHRTAAFAVEVGEPTTFEIELNIDAIYIRSAAAHLGTNVGQFLADLHTLDAPLRLIDVRLLKSRTAEKAV